MRFYKCDGCGKENQGEPLVALHGIASSKGGITLPEQFHRKDFCSTRCFWDWVTVNHVD